jgi:hypothetical protein
MHDDPFSLLSTRFIPSVNKFIYFTLPLSKKERPTFHRFFSMKYLVILRQRFLLVDSGLFLPHIVDFIPLERAKERERWGVAKIISRDEFLSTFSS